MTTPQHTTQAELREMAQDALRLAEKATKGPWFGVTNLEVQTTDVALAAVFDDGFDYDQALANCEFMGKSRQLVPELATALLAALDRVGELERVEQAARAFVAANKVQHENGAWVIGEKSRLNDELYHAGVDALEIYWRVDRVNLDDKLIEEVKTTLEDLEREVGK